PTLRLQGTGTERLVLVMDVSASMKATDARPTRFAAAQRAAHQLIAGAGRGAEVMVVEAGVHPGIRVPFTRDIVRAPAAAAAMEARDLPNHLGEALRTTLALVPPGDRRVTVHVLTDGALDPAQVQEVLDPRIRWTSVGVGGRNVGITQFALRRSYYG